jgi:hypothetical protein
MLFDYDIRAGGHRVSTRQAPSELAALLDYLRSLGCRDRDVVRLGTRSVAWRGAVYSATRADEAEA